MQIRKLHKIERNGHVCTLKLGPSETRINSWPMPGRVVRPRSRHLVGSERAAQSRIRTAKAQPTQQHNTFYSISCLQNNKIKLSWDGADLAPQTRACPYCRSPAAVKPMHNCLHASPIPSTQNQTKRLVSAPSSPPCTNLSDLFVCHPNSKSADAIICFLFYSGNNETIQQCSPKKSKSSAHPA